MNFNNQGPRSIQPTAKSIINNTNTKGFSPANKPLAPKADDEIKTPFERLQVLFNFLDFGTLYLEQNEENPAEQLIVAVNTDDEDIDYLSLYSNEGEANKEADENEFLKKNLLIHLMFTNDIFKHVENFPSDPELPETHILSFSAFLEVELKDEKHWELLHLLNEFNRSIPVGNFVIDEEDKLCFRYSLLLPERDVTNEVVLEVIQMITYFASRVNNAVVAFMKGEKDLDTILAELSQKS